MKKTEKIIILRVILDLIKNPVNLQIKRQYELIRWVVFLAITIVVSDSLDTKI